MLWLWKRGTPETAIPVGSLEEYYRRDPAVYVFPGVTDKLEVQRELLSACNNMAATILQASSVSDDAYEINKLCDVLIVSCAYMMTGCKPEDLKWKDIYHFLREDMSETIDSLLEADTSSDPLLHGAINRFTNLVPEDLRRDSISTTLWGMYGYVHGKLVFRKVQKYGD